VNGLLVIDKPAGMTSHDVVGILRRITGERSIGHLGTLDPMATGVLPMLLGKFTRLAQYFSSAEKSYSGTIRFGFATDTYDAEGQPAGPDSMPSIRCASRQPASTAKCSRCRRLTPQKRLQARPHTSSPARASRWN
jgi:tRNA pseudouridine55 synthase